MLPVRCLFAIGILQLVMSGCMSLEQQPAKSYGLGPWKVTARSVIPYGHRYEFGPFATTGIGVLQGSEIRKADAPETQVVQFRNDHPFYAFELRHADGTVARVRLGTAETQQRKPFFQTLLDQEIQNAGSVEINGELAGEFIILNVLSKEQPNAGFVRSSVGELAVVRRREPIRQSESSVAALLQPDHEMLEHYILGGELVASRRYRPQEVWIDPRLPIDTQLCIAAAMTVPLKQTSQERAASQGALLSTAATLAPSG